MKANGLSFKRGIVQCAMATSLLLSAFAGSANAAEQPGDGVEVTPIFPTISEERFRGEIAMAGLSELGYDVQKPKETDYPAMMLALSYGDADFTVHIWEHLHAAFYEKAGGDSAMVKVGDAMKGVLQGYKIDKKTADQYNIKSLEDLKKPEIAKLFDSDGDGKANLTGCNPGWGCELIVEHQLKAYGLQDAVTHDRGSYFALMADVITRYKEGKPILYFTWVPQWIDSVLVNNKDVVWLPVPYTDLPDGKNDVNTTFDGINLGSAVDTIKTVASKDFAEDNPAAIAFLSRFHIEPKDESEQNLKMHNGENSQADIKRHADEWIAAHRAEFDSWLAAARAAAKE
ncbi:glycine betaine ABC transporter substrate-binding protein [Pseudomonas matsuisoli]|uniref:Glycine betaine ABC transporter substrate-binding protein n=2 Tax=Pseudomonas matsuisoli TaxID=1515666 RepID=A0A917UXZ4_9PSED|nr:glycine betaine ABC transporter substrate-binding protein [Pseudomonas matsuisoli]